MQRLRQMMHMAVLLLLPAMCMAQGGPVSSFCERVASSRTSFSYTYVLEGQTKVMGEGSVTVQGRAYCLETSGLRIFCDGASRWSADQEAEELVIESVAEAESVLDNPVLVVTGLEREFSWKSSGTSTKFGGQNALEFRLVPKSSSEIEEASLYFAPDGGLLLGAVLVLDGTQIRLAFNSFKFEAPSSDAIFTLPAFPKSWVVTDLR